MSKLELKHIYSNYHSIKGETPAIHDLSFSVEEGEFVSLVGPSGCGKSTLLNIIVGLLQPSSGEVLIDNKPKVNNNSKLGYMFQNDNLFEWLSVWDNVALGLKITHKLNDKNKEKINFLLEEYALGDFNNHHPSELSGGMRQRVALFRTLVMDPEILLLDEPFSALDYQTRLNVSEDILKIIKEQNKTAVMVTHDISEAIAMSERVVVLSKRPARLKKILEVKFPENCKSPFMRREDINFRVYFNEVWKELNDGDGKL